MADVQALVVALGGVERAIEAVAARVALVHIGGGRYAKLNIGATGVAGDASLLGAALGDDVALGDIGATVAGGRGHRAAVDIHAIGDDSVRGADDVDA